MEDFSKYEDVLGQLICLKTYTHMCLGFPLASGLSHDTVVQDLEQAAGKLYDAFPWLSGHVIRDPPGNTGLAKILPYPPGERPSPLVWKDCRKICPSLESIMDAGGPMSMLDGDVLTTRAGLPCGYDETVEPAPVICIQSTIVDGGLLLSFAAQHNILDMNGQGQMIRLFARACRDQPFTQFELEQGNRDRRKIIRLLGLDEPRIDLTKFRSPIPDLATASTTSPEAPNLQWAYFHFSGSQLAVLKNVASTPGSWISTDDALSALLCQRIHSVRSQRIGAGLSGDTVTFCRAVNARPFLETTLPREYMGHMVHCLEEKLPVDAAAATHDVAALAGRFRAGLRGLEPAEVHGIATAVAEEEDKSTFRFGATLNMSKYDIMLSSWSGLGLYQESFGTLGKPVIAKRQRFPPMESLLYLMPKTESGDVDVAVCLRAEDIDKLKQDVVLAQYGTYVG